MSTATDTKPKQQAPSPPSATGRPAAAVSSPAKSRAAEPAKDLLAHLVEVGAPQGTRRMFEEWIANKRNETPTAHDLFAEMKSRGITRGTLNNAVAWINDPVCVLDIQSITHEEEYKALQARVDQLVNTNANLSADKLGLTHQNSFLTEQINDLTRQVRYLSLGKTKEELAGIGVKIAEQAA